jgi:U2-associated protein SR140
MRPFLFLWERSLFLVSDILHNTSAPVRNASRYRGRFEAILPSVFESLQETYR